MTGTDKKDADMNGTGADVIATVALSKPVDAHGEKVGKIGFREPTGEDIASAGVPFLIHPGGKVEVIVPSAVAMMARISVPSMPPSSFHRLRAGDFMKCIEAIMPFFTTSEAEGS